MIMSEIMETTEAMVETEPEVKPARRTRTKKAAAEGTAAETETKKTRTRKMAEKPAETLPAEKKTRTRKTAAEKAEAAEAKTAAEPKPVTRKRTAKKETVKEPETAVTLQFAGLEYKVADIVASVKAAASETVPAGELSSIEIYVKPEDFTAYYVINDKADGKYVEF